MDLLIITSTAIPTPGLTEPEPILLAKVIVVFRNFAKAS